MPLEFHTHPFRLQPADPSAITPVSQQPTRLRARLRIPRDWLAMACGLIYFGIVGLLVTIFCGTLSFILPKHTGESLGRYVHHIVFRIFTFYLRITDLLRIDLSALERLAKRPEHLIVAPNHASLWDAVFIIARLPRTICVMKKAILKNPCLGGGSRLAGYIPTGSVTRMIRDAAESLDRGGQLLLFPEGTRTAPSARWINPLKGGCALIAIRAKVPIYPVFIRSNNRFLQKSWPFWKPPIFPVHISIEVGEPIFARENESAGELTERLQAVYELELARPNPLRRQIDS